MTVPAINLNVVIIGAGLGGLAAAIATAKAGHTVTILEQAQELGEIGAGIQIPPNSSRILIGWGLKEQFEKVSVLPEALRLRSYRDGKVLSEQGLLPLTEEVYGAPYWHIHRADFHKILVAKALELGIEIRLSSHVTSVDFSTPTAYLSTGVAIPADLIIGSDGLKSRCRELLLGHSDPPHLTGDLAYRILIKASDMLPHADLRELAEKPAINFWLGPDAHAVCYLLKNGSLYNIVLLCPDNLPASVNVAPVNASEVRTFFKNWDPRLQKLLGMVQETTKWRLQNSVEMTSWSHEEGKFTLLGDACHATLPYLAQGAAMAVEDGAVIGGLLSKIESISQLPDILHIYEGVRKARTTRIVSGSTHQRDIFHLKDGQKQQERDEILLKDITQSGFPNKWKDPEFRDFMFGYDVSEEVEAAWSRYKDTTTNNSGEKAAASSVRQEEKCTSRL